MEMAANFSVVLVELDRCERGRAFRHGVARFVVLGTLSLDVLGQLVFVVGLFWPQSHGCDCRSPNAVYNQVIFLVRAVEMFQALNQDRYPRDMGELVTAGIMTRQETDPWGRPFVLDCSAAGIRVCSLGSNMFDRADDICSDEAPQR